MGDKWIYLIKKESNAKIQRNLFSIQKSIQVKNVSYREIYALGTVGDNKMFKILSDWISS